MDLPHPTINSRTYGSRRADQSGRGHYGVLAFAAKDNWGFPPMYVHIGGLPLRHQNVALIKFSALHGEKTEERGDSEVSLTRPHLDITQHARAHTADFVGRTTTDESPLARSFQSGPSVAEGGGPKAMEWKRREGGGPEDSPPVSLLLLRWPLCAPSSVAVCPLLLPLSPGA